MLNLAGPVNFAAFAGISSNNEYAEFSDTAGPISSDGGLLQSYNNVALPQISYAC
jgi:hypothetical protein